MTRPELVASTGSARLERFFFWIPTPMLAGARPGERLLACIGAFVGIAGTAFLSMLLGVETAHLPALVAPIGASAVLLFAVPASPLAQPWPVIGGNLVSGVVGLLVASHVGNPALAAGLAVGLAILAMTLLRCLHPPGGGTALLPLLAAPQLAGEAARFVVMPTLNAMLLVALGWLFHLYSGHSYPHKAGAGLPTRRGGGPAQAVPC
jgi:CBS domain-containing membrane protein